MREIICPKICRYYKPGKEEDPGCGGLEWLLPRPEVAGGLQKALAKGREGQLAGLGDEDPRLKAICLGCAFLADGCDFRDPKVSRDDCEPCGGLKAVAALLADGLDLDL